MEVIRNFAALIALVIVWDIIWKAIALWHSARKGEKIWFVLLLITNTLGVLPIVYLSFFKNSKNK